MKTLTISAHVALDTEIRVTVFENTPDRTDPFVSLRIGGPDITVALLVPPGSAPALRALAHAAEEAAEVLDSMTAQAGAA
ncbi:hypothetical protein [Streptomyces sp. NPDC001537]